MAKMKMIHAMNLWVVFIIIEAGSEGTTAAPHVHLTYGYLLAPHTTSPGPHDHMIPGRDILSLIISSLCGQQTSTRTRD